MIKLPKTLSISFDAMITWWKQEYERNPKRLEDGILCTKEQFEKYKELFPKGVTSDITREIWSFRGYKITDNKDLLA